MTMTRLLPTVVGLVLDEDGKVRHLRVGVAAGSTGGVAQSGRQVLPLLRSQLGGGGVDDESQMQLHCTTIAVQVSEPKKAGTPAAITLQEGTELLKRLIRREVSINAMRPKDQDDDLMQLLARLRISYEETPEDCLSVLNRKFEDPDRPDFVHLTDHVKALRSLVQTAAEEKPRNEEQVAEAKSLVAYYVSEALLGVGDTVCRMT